MANNFSARISAILDTSGVEHQIQNEIENRQVRLRNVSADTTNLAQSIQRALDQHQFHIRVDGANFGNITNQARQLGNNLQHAFGSTLNTIDLVNGGIGNMRRMLQGAGFNNNSINLVTRDLNDMSISVQRITSTMGRNGNISMRISGIDELGRGVTILREYDSQTGRVVNASKSFTQSFATVANAAEVEARALREANREREVLTRSSTLSNQMQTWLNNNTQAAQRFGAQIRAFQTQLQNNTSQQTLSQIRARFNEIKSASQSAGLTVAGFTRNFADLAKRALGLSSAVTVMYKAFNVIRNGVNTIVELDDALIDLRKTTTMTASEMTNFYYDANESAKKLGVTTKEIISSAADWSRLGFSDKNSATRMAELSAQFAAISPGVSIDDATTGLVSIVKAYGINVDDVLDDVMSKINKVGNTAATSNEQIINGLQNAASAMAGMNTNLDKSIALFTAAQEIAQDDRKVGNALRSIALRIRGYDEETEELSEDLVNITGDVIDLTKVASNNFQGVSLFTDETQTAYKDVYDYLKDISEIWDELDAKSRQTLMEKLFGKNRANIGLAILQNFEAAEKAMDNMAHSLGSADAEMSVITNSISYHLNALGQTWVSVAQNLIQSNSFKSVVDSLTSLANGIDWVTEKLGLLGTTGAVVALGGIIHIINTIGKMSSAVSPIVSAMQSMNMTMDGSAASAMQFAQQLSVLDGAQQRAAMSALGLSSEQQRQVTQMMQLMSATEGMTVAELERAARTTEGRYADILHAQSTDVVTSAMLRQLVASGEMTVEERNQLAASLGITNANYGQAASWDVLKASATQALAAMAHNPMTWVMIAVSALSMLVGAMQQARQEAERLRTEQISQGKETAKLSEEITDLAAKYATLSDAVKTDDSVKQDLLTTQEELIKKLGVEQSRLEELTEKYGSYTNAIKAATAEKLKEQQVDLAAALQASKDQLSALADDGTYLGFRFGQNYLDAISVSGGSGKEDAENAILRAFREAGLATGSYSSEVGATLTFPVEFDVHNPDDVLEAFEQLKQMRQIAMETGGVDTETFKAVDAVYQKYKTAVEDVISIENALITNQTDLLVQTKLIGRDVPTTTEAFQSFKQEIIKTAQSSGEFAGTNEEIEHSIEEILSKDSRFIQFYQDIADGAEDAGEKTKELAALSFSEMMGVFDTLKEDVSALQTAFSDIGKEDSFGVTYTSLAAIADKFSDVSGINNYISRLAEAGTSAEKVSEILNELVSEKINNIVASNNLADADEKVISAMLREAGIANSDKAAADVLARAKAQVEFNSRLEKEGIEGVIRSLSDETQYTDQARAEMYRLAAQFIATGNTGLDLSQQINILKQIALEAGVARAAVASVFTTSTVKPEIVKPSQMGKAGAMTTDAGTGGKSGQDAVDYLLKQINDQADKLRSNYEFTPYVPSGGGGGGSGGGSSNDMEEEAEEQLERINWIDRAINKVERSIKKLRKTADSSYKSLNSKLSATEEIASEITNEISLQQQAYEKYMKAAEDVGLSEELAAKVRDGSIDIEEYDQETADLIQEYEEWYDKALDCADAIDELHESLAELYEDRFNAIAKDYENQLALMEHLSNTYNNGIDELNARGYLMSTQYYEALKSVEEQNIAILTKEMNDLIAALNAAMASGEIEEYSDAWLISSHIAR